MKCPRCQTEETSDIQHRVLDSREHRMGIRRRRECGRCYVRFTTIEVSQEHLQRVIDMQRQVAAIMNAIEQVGKLKTPGLLQSLETLAHNDPRGGE